MVLFDTVKATGKLAFLDNVADKHKVDKAGNIITKFWELKQIGKKIVVKALGWK